MSAGTGWRRDPFGRHEWRYFVEDSPTSSVGDQGLLSEDPPPAEPDPLPGTAHAPGPAATPGSEPAAEAEPGPVGVSTALLDEPAAAPVPVPPEPTPELLVLGTSEPSPAAGTSVVPGAEPPGGRAVAWWPTVGYVLSIYAAVRVALFVADLFAAHVNFGGNLSGPLASWDAGWYLKVAQHFYPAHPAMTHGQLTYSEAGFEPLFPILIRALMVIGLSPVQAAVGVSLIAGAVATVLVWRLGAALFDEETGTVGATLFAVFPGMGVVWGLLYSECVALALVAGCLLLLTRERWVWAGVLGALATLTSPMALPLCPAALVAGAQALSHRRPPKAWITAAIVPAGFLGFAAFLAARYHDLFFWWHLQHQAWGATVDFGHGLLHQLSSPLTGGYVGKGWMEWVGVVLVVAAVAVMARTRTALPIATYCAGVFALAFAGNQLGFKPRFLAWAFPALISTAALTKRRGWQPIAVLFAAVGVLVFLVYTMYGNYIVQP